MKEFIHLYMNNLEFFIATNLVVIAFFIIMLIALLKYLNVPSKRTSIRDDIY